ncbi:MAG: LLM class flavin-dependent oxidoreductase [Acidimicrobiales bacterium]
MRVGIFLFGGVEMDDAGSGPPVSTDRRYDNKVIWEATERILEVGVLADRRGFDSFWLTEHHFQYEGYEVVPNGILAGVALAERTEQLRIGTMFNVVGNWHPLRLAEDFATLHNLSRGRAVLGLGRGTVPREAEPLGSRIGSFDNPDAVEADRFNRRQFDEAVEVIRLALDQERFAFHGEIYDIPPPGIPDRGGQVEELSLIPRPLYPYETWQAITSPPTLEIVPRKGWGGVMWLKHHVLLERFWNRYAEIYQEEHGRALEPGENRMLVVNTCVADTREEAVAQVRPGHDEFWKFLGPYGWSRGYLGADGKPAPAGLIPTLEESMDGQVWLVGTADDVAEQIDRLAGRLGGLHDLILFPAMPGDRYEIVEDQLHRLADGVLPRLG